jgi:hypothetical protein
MLNYLRITGPPVGVILNFKRARLEWERIVLTKDTLMDVHGSESAAVDLRAAQEET